MIKTTNNMLEENENILHDIKSQVNVIYAAVQLMQLYDEIPEVAKPHFGIVTRGVRRIAKLVTDASDSKKLTRGRYAPRLKNCDIVEIVDGIAKEAEATAETKGIELKTIAACKKKVMPMDKYILERILLNLLSNAMKFTQAGGSIAVITDCDDNFVSITVEDSGEGIPDDKIGTMFDRYASFSNNGTGIGLTIVKELTSLLRGEVSAKNNEGKSGLQVKIKLPVLEEALTENEGDELFWYNSFMDSDLVQIELSDEY